MKPVETFEGVCVAIIHRTDDDEDKLIVVTPDNAGITNDEIRAKTHFQEQWFTSEIIKDLYGEDVSLYRHHSH